MNAFTSELKKLTAQLEIDIVIEKLNQLFTKVNSQLETMLIITKANKNKLENSYLCNLIKREDYIIENSKILNKILFLIDEVDSNIKEYLPYISGLDVSESESNKDVILFLGASPGKFKTDIL
jgi:hypothetical protein